MFCKDKNWYTSAQVIKLIPSFRQNKRMFDNLKIFIINPNNTSGPSLYSQLGQRHIHTNVITCLHWCGEAELHMPLISLCNSSYGFWNNNYTGCQKICLTMKAAWMQFYVIDNYYVHAGGIPSSVQNNYEAMWYHDNYVHDPKCSHNNYCVLHYS